MHRTMTVFHFARFPSELIIATPYSGSIMISSEYLIISLNKTSAFPLRNGSQSVGIDGTMINGKAVRQRNRAEPETAARVARS